MRATFMDFGEVSLIEARGEKIDEDREKHRLLTHTHAHPEATQRGQVARLSPPPNIGHKHGLISFRHLLTFTLGRAAAPLSVGAAAACLGPHDHVPVVAAVGDHGVVEKRAETCLAVRRIHWNFALDGLVDREESR